MQDSLEETLSTLQESILNGKRHIDEINIGKNKIVNDFAISKIEIGLNALKKRYERDDMRENEFLKDQITENKIELNQQLNQFKIIETELVSKLFQFSENKKYENIETILRKGIDYKHKLQSLQNENSILENKIEKLERFAINQRKESTPIYLNPTFERYLNMINSNIRPHRLDKYNMFKRFQYEEFRAFSENYDPLNISKLQASLINVYGKIDDIKKYHSILFHDYDLFKLYHAKKTSTKPFSDYDNLIVLLLESCKNEGNVFLHSEVLRTFKTDSQFYKTLDEHLNYKDMKTYTRVFMIKKQV